MPASQCDKCLRLRRLFSSARTHNGNFANSGMFHDAVFPQQGWKPRYRRPLTYHHHDQRTRSNHRHLHNLSPVLIHSPCIVISVFSRFLNTVVQRSRPLQGVCQSGLLRTSVRFRQLTSARNQAQGFPVDPGFTSPGRLQMNMWRSSVVPIPSRISMPKRFFHR